ncbi:hypothetical protein Phum_PHUM562920 [Pediculus humanus corporis]|uniref:Uncharacterized protein n=1 Tax=Pediculus humanus subsp. corporis TaxID=121224 RepID=E0W0T0_PEDHC|nr:uncharacterized protein Phum_PHUM562920 [Pediculus humanus corporis]EEB19236.1 hypothetical protein Phum_PHUM562920 [Pediculus humanus corporis]
MVAAARKHERIETFDIVPTKEKSLKPTTLQIFSSEKETYRNEYRDELVSNKNAGRHWNLWHRQLPTTRRQENIGCRVIVEIEEENL